MGIIGVLGGIIRGKVGDLYRAILGCIVHETERVLLYYGPDAVVRLHRDRVTDALSNALMDACPGKENPSQV